MLPGTYRRLPNGRYDVKLRKGTRLNVTNVTDAQNALNDEAVEEHNTKAADEATKDRNARADTEARERAKADTPDTLTGGGFGIR